MPASVLQWGISFILAIQNWGDWLILPMNALTFTGNPEFYLLIMPALYWSLDRRLGLRLAVIFLLNLAANLIFKIALHEPRPYWVDPQVRLLSWPEYSFGLPSGHAQNAVVVWGMLAAYLRTAWAWPGAIVLIGLIGFSRMYLGVHYPTDVLGGWILGAVGLLLFFRLERPAATQLNKLGEAWQIAGVFAASVLIILIGGATSSSVSAGWQLPGTWSQTAAVQAATQPINPFSIGDVITSASTFFGFATGAILLNGRLTFDAGGPWLKRLARYLLGAVVVFVLWQGLGGLFELVAAEESLPGYVLRFIRYGLIGGWISALGPLVFIWAGLAEKQTITPNHDAST